MSDDDKEAILTKVTREVADIIHQVAEKAAEDFFRIAPGQEEVRAREFNAIVRRAQAGDMVAQDQLERLAEQNGHLAGEEVDCPVCEGINGVVSKEADNG